MVIVYIWLLIWLIRYDHHFHLMNICLTMLLMLFYQSWMSSSIPDNSVTSLTKKERKAPVHKYILRHWCCTEVFIDIGQEIERPDDIVINWSEWSSECWILINRNVIYRVNWILKNSKIVSKLRWLLCAQIARGNFCLHYCNW